MINLTKALTIMVFTFSILYGSPLWASTLLFSEDFNTTYRETWSVIWGQASRDWHIDNNEGNAGSGSSSVIAFSHTGDTTWQNVIIDGKVKIFTGEEGAYD